MATAKITLDTTDGDYEVTLSESEGWGDNHPVYDRLLDRAVARVKAAYNAS